MWKFDKHMFSKWMGKTRQPDHNAKHGIAKTKFISYAKSNVVFRVWGCREVYDMPKTGWWLQRFRCLPLPGEMILFDEHVFEMG